MNKNTGIFALVLAMGMSAGAAITYVDAQSGASGNTFATGSTLEDETWFGPVAGGNTTNQWIYRGPPVENNVGAFDGTAYQVEVADYSGVPELTTQTSVPVAGNYDVWVFFLAYQDGWNISAGLTSGDLTTYSVAGAGVTAGVVTASTLTFAGNPGDYPSIAQTYAVKIGNVAVAAGEDLKVFIHKLEGDSSPTRTFYDGIGFEYTGETLTEWDAYVINYGLSGVPDADFDRDGESDLYEYAMYGNATNALVQGVPTQVSYNPANDEVTYSHAILTSAQPGITYTITKADNLTLDTWGPESWTSVTTNASGNAAYDEVTYTGGGSAASTKFIRVKIDTQP